MEIENLIEEILVSEIHLAFQSKRSANLIYLIYSGKSRNQKE
jgi:hypothetical protein